MRHVAGDTYGLAVPVDNSPENAAFGFGVLYVPLYHRGGRLRFGPQGEKIFAGNINLEDVFHPFLGNGHEPAIRNGILNHDPNFPLRLNS